MTSEASRKGFPASQNPYRPFGALPPEGEAFGASGGRPQFISRSQFIRRPYDRVGVIHVVGATLAVARDLTKKQRSKEAPASRLGEPVPCFFGFPRSGRLAGARCRL